MSSYATERVRQLTSQLDALERQLEQSSTGRHTGPSAADAAAADFIASNARLHRLQSTLSSIELSAGSLPVEKLLKALDEVEHVASEDHPAGGRVTSENDEAVAFAKETLEWITLARITVASYGIVLEAFLDAASKISEEIWYWTEVEEDPVKRTAYLVQTLPFRLTRLTISTALALQDTVQKGHAVSFADVLSLSNIRTFASLSSTRNHLISSLFPHTAACQALQESRLKSDDNDGADDASIRSKASRFGYVQREGVKGGRSLVLRRLSPLYLGRQEARLKRKALQKVRDAIALQIGRLAINVIDLTDAQGEVVDWPSEAKFGAFKADVSARVEELCKAVFQPQCVASTVAGVPLSSLLNHVQLAKAQAILSRPAASTAAPEASKPRELADELRFLLSDLLPLQARCSSRFLSPTCLGRPAFLTRRWPLLVLAPTVILLGGRAAWRSREAIKERIRETGATIRGFWGGWVVEPIMGIIDTVRRPEEERAVILSKDSLRSDLESLQRMVASFSKEKYGMSADEVRTVAEKVKEGDLTPVLRIYEDELRRPLRSTVQGSLVRALLIQVQKVKVDMEMAMAGIDRLLKSQELLFGCVGIAPSLGVLYVFGSWAANVLSQVTGRGRRKVKGEVKIQSWEAMRRIDRLITISAGKEAAATSTLPIRRSRDDDDNNDDDDDDDLSKTLDPLTQGLLVLDLQYLRRSVAPLLSSRSSGTAKRLRRGFLQDVRDLEDESLERRAKEKVVERMWRSWNGVLGWAEVA